MCWEEIFHQFLLTHFWSMFQFQILLFVIFLVFLWGVIGEHWTVFIAEYHCVKSVRIRSFSGLYFPTFGLNTDQKNFEYGHFSRSALPTVKWEKTNMTIRWLVRNVSSHLLPPHSCQNYVFNSLFCPHDLFGWSPNQSNRHCMKSVQTRSYF